MLVAFSLFRFRSRHGGGRCLRRVLSETSLRLASVREEEQEEDCTTEKRRSGTRRSSCGGGGGAAAAVIVHLLLSLSFSFLLVFRLGSWPFWKASRGKSLVETFSVL